MNRLQALSIAHNKTLQKLEELERKIYICKWAIKKTPDCYNSRTLEELRQQKLVAYLKDLEAESKKEYYLRHKLMQAETAQMLSFFGTAYRLSEDKIFILP